MKRWLPVAVLGPVVAAGLTACTTPAAQAPRCSAVERVALIAQAVPSSTYIACIAQLPAGWSSGDLRVENGHAAFELRSDRSPGHPIEVDVRQTCERGTATATAPRTPGGRTYLELREIDPRYVGTMYDVFPGGCVSYRFDLERGTHIALMAQLQQTVGFVPRQELRHKIEQRLGVELDP